MVKINSLLSNIKECIDNAPTKKNKKMDWDELLEMKENARVSVEVLSKIFGSSGSQPTKLDSQRCTGDVPWS